MSTHTDKRFAGIDYTFRPASYADEGSDPLSAILRNVMGTNRRRMIRDYWEQGRLEELDEALLANELGGNHRHQLGLIHPSFMGGEYLPGYLPHETEIARIELESTTSDVISIRAQIAGDSLIRYRVVDEYDSGFSIKPEESAAPLSLEELIGLIDTANDGDGGGLAMCYNQANRGAGADIDSLRHFTTVTSEVYRDLFTHYDALHEHWVGGVKLFARAASNLLLQTEADEEEES